MDEFDDAAFRNEHAAEEEPLTIYKSRRRLRVPHRKTKLKRVDSKKGHARGRRKWPWIVGLSLAAVVILVAAFGLWFYISLKTKEPRMRVAGIDSVLRPQDGGPETTLIMGVDRGSVEGEEGPGRSDIMMLLTIAPDGKYGGMISIPRDSRVQISGHKGLDKINAAHAYGGPALAIRTVDDVTGLDVNHFLEMDFEGFKRIVNAVGGVNMFIPHSIHDKYAGDVPAGNVKLTGDQALALVRARYDVKAVPNGDVDRQKNQRAFLEAFLSAVAHQRNPFTIMKIADAVSQSAKTDMTFYKMFTLGSKLQSLKQGKLETVSAPGTPRTVHGVWYYILDTAGLQSIIERFKTNAHPAVAVAETTVEQAPSQEPAHVRLKVLNGSGVAGVARKVAKQLASKGYEKITTGNSKMPYAKTTVYFAPGYDKAAAGVSSDVGRSSSVKLDEDITTRYESDIVVVIGSDHS